MKIYIFIILCVLFWSGNFVIGRYVSNDITPIQMAFFRWLITAIIILPLFIINIKNIYVVFKKEYLILIILSILGIATFNTILYFGLNFTSATNALIINSTVPMIIIILSYFILKTTINTIQILGILISTLGVVFLILNGNFSNIFHLEFNSGDLLLILSSLIWALYSVLIKFKPKGLNDIEYFSTIVMIGIIILLPIYLYQNYTFQSQMILLKNNYLVFIYISVFTSILSYYFWHQGINKIGANKTGQFTHLMPIFGIILAYIFLNERLMYYHIIGALFILSGIYISIFYKKNIAK